MSSRCKLPPSLPLPGMERNAEIRQCDILRIVRERLEGFRWRQAGREELRKRKREAKRRVPAVATQEDLYERREMAERHIKVTYRATFQGPIGPLNISGVNADKVEVPVEIRETSKGWIACVPGSRSAGMIFSKISAQPSADSLKSQMSIYFRRRVKNWETWSAQDIVAPMNPEEYVVRDGKVYVIEEQKK